MDKYDFNIRVGQLKKLVENNDYDNALKIVDSIDWRKVSDTRLLETVAKVYEKNDIYAEAKEILLLAYEKSAYGKRFLYKLVLLAISDENIKDARDYYNEFEDLSSNDARKYILKYKLLSLEGADISEKIKVLELYNSKELSEEYMYELASLYEKAGEKEKAIKMLDNIILLFAKGEYVDKAFDLKLNKMNVALNDYQVELLEKKIDLEYQKKNQKVKEEVLDPIKEEPKVEIKEEKSFDKEIKTNKNLGIAETIKNIISGTNEKDLELDIEEDNINEDNIGIETNIEDVEAEAEEIKEIEVDASELVEKEEALPEALQDIQLALDEINANEETEELVATNEEPTEEAEIAIEVIEDNDIEEAVIEETIIEDNSSEEEIFVLEEDPSLELIEEESSIDDMEEEIYIVDDTEDIATDIDIVLDDSTDEVLADEEDTDADDELVSIEEDYEEYIDEEGFVSGIIEIISLEDDYDASIEKAKEILKEASIEQGLEKATLKIKASKLNEKDLDEVLDKLIDKDLIIEEAQDLSDEYYEYIKELVENSAIQTNFVLIVDDKEESVEEEFYEEVEEDSEDEYSELEEYEVEEVYEELDLESYEEDNQEIDLEINFDSTSEELSIDDFATYASNYADEIDCVISGKSMLALYERIEMMQAKRIPLTKDNAKALIIEAADKAEKPNFIKGITNVLTFNKKYDKDDRLILKEEHFIQ